MISPIEVHLDLRFYFDRIPVEQVRLELPLFDGVEGSGREERVAADKFRALDISIFADDDFHHDESLNVLLFRVRRVVGIDFRDKQTLLDAGGNADALGRSKCWNWAGGGCVAVS